VTKTVYDVTAKRWSGGWELHIDGVGVTQSRTLDDAPAMARDYIALDLDVPEDSFDVVVKPQLAGQVLDEQAGREIASAERGAPWRSKSKVLDVLVRSLDRIAAASRTHSHSRR